jgi:hypothetical protein
MARVKEAGGVIVAAGPVSRILSATLLLRDGHSSGPRIAARLKRPTRRFDAPSRHVPAAEAADFLPIWSCSVWGLPCPRHYCRGGALLPHLFTLTPLLRRYIFCGTFRRADLNPPSRTLSGTLLCGVRTFLSLRPRAREATVRSGCLRNDYRRRVAGVGPRTLDFRISDLSKASYFVLPAVAVRARCIHGRLIPSRVWRRCRLGSDG